MLREWTSVLITSPPCEVRRRLTTFRGTNMLTPTTPPRSIAGGTTAVRPMPVSLAGARLLVISRYPADDGTYAVLEERGLDDLRVDASETSWVDEIEDRLVEAWDRDAGEPHLPCKLAVELSTGLVIHQHST
jgi:hypothetical protein